MNKRTLGAILVLGVFLGTTAIPTPVSASEHLMYIDEVFGGAVYSADAQFVELRMYSGSQNFVDGTEITVFDNEGDFLVSHPIESDVTGGAPGDSILIGTFDAETLFDMDMDFQVPLNLPASGRVCFGTSVSSHYDCVTWGDYTGTAPQNPVNDPEGMIAGASFLRVYGDDGIDAGDDHNDNARDFRITTPDPRNNADDTFAASQRIKFGGAGFTAQEGTLATHEIPLSRLGDTTGAVNVNFALTNGTSEGNDYMPADGVVTFGSGVNHIDVGVNVVNNDSFEGPETVNMSIRGPTSPAFLAAPVNATLTILDFEDDTDPPTSRVTNPAHGSAFRASRLSVIKGRADDGVGLVEEVEVALVQKRTDGSCRWFNGTRFVRRPCSNRQFISTNTATDGDWRRRLDDPLPKSKGTSVKFYTVYSRATDAGEPANIEAIFEPGRNANRFEIK